ncbi:MAG: SLBB domain-containing protein [Bacteroidetes bacterium]|nr:SLBB domain-containing protein [Bacteroidota bacterium]
MKKLIAVFAICLVFQGLKSQFIFPGLTDSSSQSMNPFALDTPQIKKQIQEIPQQKQVSKDSEVIVNEAEIKKLEVQAQRLKLEKEINDLKQKTELSPEEKELLRIKTDNLRIVALKERILLEEEFAQTKKEAGSKKYPEAVIYGQQFFRDGTFKFYDKTDEIVATEGYVLGSGDAIQLEVWGYRYWSKSYVISESGSIDIAGYQKIFLKGLSLRQARNIIASRLGLTGNESSFSVTVTRPRMVSINILGEVFRPGTYTLPATNSAFNALVSMGGPSNIGSVRNIYIKRDGVIRDSFDVYEYFKDIAHQRDIYLQNNDYVIVMPAGNVVQVSGHVRRPGTYEVKNSETLSEVLEFAGGAFSNTYLKDVIITRIYNSQYEVISVNLDSLRRNKKDFKMAGVQSVNFKSISSDNQFAVLIHGAVSVPGTYRVKQGLRISSLIKNANGLTSDAYLDKGYLVRTNKDYSKKYITFSPKEALAKKGTEVDLLVEDRDSIYIFKRHDIQKFYTVQISGAVYKPFTTNYIAGLQLSELLFMSGGLTEEADEDRGFVIRTNADFEKRLIPFSPVKVMNKTDGLDLELLPKDEVIIYSKTEFLRKYQLSIHGAVKKPQSLAFSENTRVSDLISMAGGLEESAFKRRALVTHTDIKTGLRSSRTVDLEIAMANPESDANLVLDKNDIVMVFDLSQLKSDFSVAIFGEVRNGGEFPYSDNMTLQNLVDVAGGVAFVAAGTEVEIVRNLFVENGNYVFLKPQIIVSRISDNLTLDSGLSDFILQPFDKVFIRRNPNFIASKMVYIDGAVMYPGYYALKGENEKLNSIFSRAGGFRTDAMINGIRISRKRSTGDSITLVVNSRKAIHRRRSHYNMIVKGGDRIVVPYAENVVTIAGDMNNSGKEIGAYFIHGKRAKYYIRNFGGGFTRTSDRRHVVVVHANGARVATHHYILFRVYPKVKAGSRIEVVTKPSKNRDGNRFDFDIFLTKFLTRATAMLSIIGLYKVAISK